MPLRRVFIFLAAGLLTMVVGLPAPAYAQTSAPRVTSKPAVKPTWHELTDAQREALAPLQPQWDTLDAERKRRWLTMAARYPELSAEGKQRFHERMPGYASLTPAERETARSNFRKAYELPLQQRQTVVDQYTQLPEEKKQAIAASKTKKNAEPPRRQERNARGSTKDANKDTTKTKGTAKENVAPTNGAPDGPSTVAPALTVPPPPAPISR